MNTTIHGNIIKKIIHIVQVWNIITSKMSQYYNYIKIIATLESDVTMFNLGDQITKETNNPNIFDAWIQYWKNLGYQVIYHLY